MAREYVFRFWFVYLLLWCAATQVLGGLVITPVGALPALGPLWPMRDITEWTAGHVFGVAAPFEPGTSGDTPFYWVQTAWIACVSLVLAGVWGVTDAGRSRTGHLRTGFTVFLRLALAAQMFYFGMAKVVPTQFTPPALTTLVQPIGHASLSNLLWVFMGASVPYQVFTGAAEVVAGLLLIWPRTVTVGALLALADMVQVFALNMTYDVGLKQISFHFIVMALLLLAPDAARLIRAVLRPTTRLAALQVAFGLYLLGTFAFLQVRQWHAPDGPAHPPSALYGIWDIDELSVDGHTGPAVLNDYDRRWRRAIFDTPERMAFQRTDDSLARYGITIDAGAHTLRLTKGASRSWQAVFDVARPADDQLTVAGTMDGHAIRMRMTRVGLDTFPLLNSRFRWIRPPDPLQD